MSLFKLILSIFLIFNILGCVEKTTYSGKIITSEDLSNLKISNKDELMQKFGQPSYIDNIQNKFFYYTEMVKSKNFFNQKVEYSYLFVFEIDEFNKIIGTESINLLEKDNNIYQKQETNNNIIKKGFLEKVFGGVGPNKLPNSP
tara:strand:+ start:288 stop:719 length:432 start_codon:yes stop_codon:yes gene_type:complete